MKRRYVCIPTVGHLEQNLERIRSQISGHHLAHRYPVVRYERPRRRSSRGGGQLYLFLGLDLNAEEQARSIPGDDWTFLKQMGFHPYKELLEESQIKSMTSTNEVSMEGFWFRYKQAEIPPPPPTLGDWDESAETPGQPDSDTLQASDHCDRLLWWLSARGHGKWADLSAAICTLEVGEGRLSPAAVTRNLVLLGHIESLPIEGTWSIAPRCRIIPVLDETYSFLAGARTAADTQPESGHEVVTRQLQANGDGPTRLAINSNAKDSWAGVESVGQASMDLAGLLPILSDWIAALPILDRPSLGGGTLERFDGRSWQRDPPMIETDFGYRGATGLYRFVSTEGLTLWSAYFQQDSQRWHRADLSGLKFATLAAETADKLQAVYTNASGDLLIPRSQRWPLLYERALVLASGWLPVVDQGHLCYRQVGKGLARTLALKLGIDLTED